MDLPQPRRLTVTTGIDTETGMARLTFEDTGPGVAPDLRLRIFDPFFTTKPTGIGTGIGLAVCHGVIESHGGTIAVEDASGGGARFTILLPPGDAVDAFPDSVAEEQAADGDGQRILVVDDEVEIAAALAEVLTMEGLHVDVADSGPAALDCRGRNDLEGL